MISESFSIFVISFPFSIIVLNLLQSHHCVSNITDWKNLKTPIHVHLLKLTSALMSQKYRVTHDKLSSTDALNIENQSRTASQLSHSHRQDWINWILSLFFQTFSACCGYLLEILHYEYSQHMFHWRNEENYWLTVPFIPPYLELRWLR